MMEAKSKAYLSNTLSTTIRACSLDKNDLKKIVDKLQEYNKTASEIEVNHFRKNLEKEGTTENLDLMVKNLEEAFDLRLTVTGTEGQELFGSVIKSLTIFWISVSRPFINDWFVSNNHPLT